MLDFVHHLCFFLCKNRNVSEICSISVQAERICGQKPSGTRSVRTDAHEIRSKFFIFQQSVSVTATHFLHLPESCTEQHYLQCRNVFMFSHT